MENASKALLIAGAILIVIILISVGLLVIRSTGSIQDRVKIDSETMAIRTFNSQFIYYEREENSASQIKALLNTAQSSNGVNGNHIVDVVWENNSGERTPVKGSEITANNTYSVALEYGTDGYIRVAKLTAKLSSKPTPEPEPEPEEPELPTDSTAPIIIVSSNNAYKKSQTGEISIADYDTGLKNGTYTIKYTWTQKAEEPNWNNIDTTTTIKVTDGATTAKTSVTKGDGTGTYYLHAQAINLEDKAGNKATPTAKGTFLLDNTPPKITSVKYNSSTDTITITAQDEHSGIGGYATTAGTWTESKEGSYSFNAGTPTNTATNCTVCGGKGGQICGGKFEYSDYTPSNPESYTLYKLCMCDKCHYTTVGYVKYSPVDGSTVSYSMPTVCNNYLDCDNCIAGKIYSNSDIYTRNVYVKDAVGNEVSKENRICLGQEITECKATYCNKICSTCKGTGQITTPTYDYCNAGSPSGESYTIIGTCRK